jgi:hypothetical protein
MTPVFRTAFVIATISSLAATVAAHASESCARMQQVINSGDSASKADVISAFKAVALDPLNKIDDIIDNGTAPELIVSSIPIGCYGSTDKDLILQQKAVAAGPAVGADICNTNSWQVTLNANDQTSKADVILALKGIALNPGLKINAVLTAVGSPNQLVMDVIAIPYVVPATQAPTAMALATLAQINKTPGASAVCDNTVYKPNSNHGDWIREGQNGNSEPEVHHFY